MTEHTPAAARDGRGRFVPGCSGNPAGKKPGTRNRATVLKELLRDGEAEAAGRVIIARAVAGDVVAGRFLFERLDPKPRGRPIALPCAAGTLAERFAAVFAAVAAGELTPDEALALGRLLDLERKLLGAAPDAREAAPALTADEREAAVHAELAAVFGEAALAPRPKATPEPPPEPAESLNSACIPEAQASDIDEKAEAAAEARDCASDAPATAGSAPPSPMPPPAVPAAVTRRRIAYWQGSARVRRKLRRAGMSVTQTASPT
ncbi:MAG: DUF5681 domain-containing protein [Pseudomonadota bacterium]